MKGITIKMTINYSKTIAFFVLLFGTIVSMYLKDASVFIAAVPSVAAILAMRDYAEKNKPSC